MVLHLPCRSCIAVSQQRLQMSSCNQVSMHPRLNVFLSRSQCETWQGWHSISSDKALTTCSGCISRAPVPRVAMGMITCSSCTRHHLALLVTSLHSPFAFVQGHEEPMAAASLFPSAGDEHLITQQQQSCPQRIWRTAIHPQPHLLLRAVHHSLGLSQPMMTAEGDGQGVCSSPFLTRYSAKSVASMSGERPASIFLGLILMVDNTPVAIRMQSFAVSTLSNINCHACKRTSLAQCCRGRHAASSFMGLILRVAEHSCGYPYAVICSVHTVTHAAMPASIHTALSLHREP